MSTISYLSVIERYHEYHSPIRELLISIITGIVSEKIFTEKSSQCEAMEFLGDHYPFVNLLYVLDQDGIQTSDNVGVTKNHNTAYTGRGANRNQRQYYLLAKASSETVVTEPYLSNANRKLCVSVVARATLSDNKHYYLIIDVDLAAIVEFLMGDMARRRAQPAFKWIYVIFVVGLLLVVGELLFIAFSEMFTNIRNPDPGIADRLRPFSTIIFITLGLAIFDLAKTTLEEEVLMHKDVFRHSSTRRTITRFIAAILIAVSIESLLLMFKSALGQSEYLIQAVWMMMASVGLLIGLGIYVYLGAKAESLLLASRR